MSFIDSPFVPNGKIDRVPVPAGEENKFFSADEWNNHICQPLLDTRKHVLNGFIGIEERASAPSGLSDLSTTTLWGRTDGNLVRSRIGVDSLIALGPVTTKGDLLVFNGTNFAKLAAGADGFGIVADSSQALGIKWGAISAAQAWKIANDYPGADIGAKINAAQVDLPSGGTVIVLPGDYTQTTKVVVESGITLKLGIGTFSNSFSDDSGALGLEAYNPPFSMKSNATILGSGWGTRIMNNEATHFMATAVKDYASTPNNDVVGESNLLIKDVCFIGNPGSNDRFQSGSLQFGNIKNVTIDHCLFDGCDGYGPTQASSSTSGHHGDGFVVKNCSFLNVATQQVVAVNCANVDIHHNTFYPTSVNTNYTIIDLESNTSADIIRNFRITDNIFDITTSAIFNPGSMIQIAGGTNTPYQFPFAGRPTYGVITGNICVSGDSQAISPNWASFAQGINLANCDHVTVADNEIAYCSYPINVASCGSIKVHDNDLQGGKNNDGANLILVTNTVDSYIGDNTLVEHNGTDFASPGIGESGSSDFNIFCGNRISYYPDTAPSSIVRDCRIDLVGAHSRAFNNILGHGSPAPVDAPLITTIAELRSLPIPGTRDASAPPVVMLGGYVAQGDGGFSVWKYDFSYAGSDNGITAVIPQYRTSGTGAWVRATSAPTMTSTARDALVLSSADFGLELLNTTTNKKQFWDGSAWKTFDVAAYPLPSTTSDVVSAGAIAIDGSILNTLHQIALSANATLSVSSPVAGETYQFKIVNAGAFTLAWPGTFKWPGGTAPVITTSGTDYVTASYNGTNYYATFSQAFA